MSKTAMYFEKFANARVLCVGDIMLDHFVYGSVERISPEGPIPVLKLERDTYMLGGVGNVIANLASLGIQTSVVSVVGKDAAAASINDKLKSIDVDVTGLVMDDERPTSLKTRYISAGQQLLRTDREQVMSLTGRARDRVFQEINTHIADTDIVVLSDYGKGVIDPELCRYVMEQGKRVIVDPKGRDYSLYKGAYLITPNKSELAEASGMPTETDDQVIAAAQHVMQTCGIQNILATRSQDGMTIISSDADPVHISTDVREVFDVSGAGDTVVAAMSAMLASGANLSDAADIANIAGGIVVGKVGTAVVTVSDMETQVMGKRHVSSSWDEAVEQVERWKKNGLSVGFTNGCFDLLHPGHVSLLEQAKSRCDRLIVGLNTDDSIKRLKGADRPVQDETSRTTVLQALSAVDMVVLFAEDTPELLIHAVSPDLLVKGADYTVDTVVGAKHVMSYGGEVFLAELKDGQSTTGMIARSAA